MKNSFVNNLKHECSKTTTLNGSVTYSTSMSKSLDLFFKCGASRNLDPSSIIDYVRASYLEDPNLTLIILFYLRSVREGQGERRLFRIAMNDILSNNKYDEEYLTRLLVLVPEVGRWDDLFYMINPNTQRIISNIIIDQFYADKFCMKDGKSISLLAKWLPTSKNKSMKELTYKVRKMMEMSEESYRTEISELRSYLNIIEKKLVTKEYSRIEYDKIPSRAFSKYMSLFAKKDYDRFTEFMNKVKSGEKSINTTGLYPYDIIHKLENGDSDHLTTLWYNLKDYECKNSLVVCDVSGSMLYGEIKNIPPIDVSISLGIYTAQHNSGPFHNMLMTFSANPRLVELSDDKNIRRLYNQVNGLNWGANTNIDKVFDVILKSAIESKCSQEDMPSTIYIISDMEFDECVESHDTNYEHAKSEYKNHGYKLPHIVFWNVNSLSDSIPVIDSESEVSLVSGASPIILDTVLEGLTPYESMIKLLKKMSFYDILDNMKVKEI